MNHAVVIEEMDNVAVALIPLSPGMTADCSMPDGSVCPVLIRDTIPRYHKFALRDISQDFPIIKYGEPIAAAGTFIFSGSHVHIHNTKKLERRSVPSD